MGMGNYACGAFVISYDELKKICKREIEVIESHKYFPEFGWEGIAKWLAWDDNDDIKDVIFDCVESEDTFECERVANDTIIWLVEQIDYLKSSFNRETGLKLYFDTYDEDGGSRYDEPNDHEGCIFCVDGMITLTPAGEKYKNIIREHRWTQFG